MNESMLHKIRLEFAKLQELLTERTLLNQRHEKAMKELDTKIVLARNTVQAHISIATTMEEG